MSEPTPKANPQLVATDAPNWAVFSGLFLCGVAAGFGQAPYDLPAITIVSLAFALWTIKANGKAKSFASGWLLGFGYFLHVMVWVTEPFLVEADTFGWLAFPAWALMAAGLAVFWGIASRISPNSITLVLMLAAAEFLRSFVFSGLPWGLIGYVWIDSVAYLISSIIGPFGVTLATFAAAYLVAFAKVSRRAIFVVGVILFDFVGVPTSDRIDQKTATVKIVHPSVPQNEKWHPDLRKKHFDNLVLSSLDGPTVDLTVWPEASLTIPMEDAYNSFIEMTKRTKLLFGQQFTPDFQLYFNAATLLGPDAQVLERYFKSHLVPFGEYFPGGELAARIGLRGLAARDGNGFMSGPGPALLSVPEIGQIQPLICYEGIFPHLILRGENRPHLLVLMTNDAWFGEKAGPAQHFAQARARAIEFGLPMVRSANLGTSAIIDRFGRVRESLEPTAAGSIVTHIPPSGPPTIYARLGEWPILVAWVMLLIFALRRNKIS